MKDVNIELYKMMYLIRSSEYKIQEIYHEDEMKTPMHMSMGEEAVVVGVVKALDPIDQVVGTYRSHALYLSKTGETDLFFAEMFGKETGCVKGKSGSMHLSSKDNGLLCCSAIVGSSIPVAVGAAFANKYNNNGKKVAVFFGDGAMDEGVFWESINYASVNELPILFICEDNGYAVHTARNKRQNYNPSADLFKEFGFNTYESISTDVEEIYNLTRKAIQDMNKNNRPCFLRLRYYRYLEHVGINTDFQDNYRSKLEYEDWKKRDPIVVQVCKLFNLGITLDQFTEIESIIDKQINKSIEFARESKFPEKGELYKGVWA